MVGPTGEAWVPIHGVLSLSNAPKALADIHALYAEMAHDHAAAGVKTGFLFTTMSSNAIVVEPVYFWPEGWRDVHESAIEPAHLARLTSRPPNPPARALVVETRTRVLEILRGYGAGHFQIGRTYPYRESRDAASVALLDSLKTFADPHGAINPGVLGFPIQGRRS
jgi:D-lactate dehydrogenase (cytochrome)